MRQRDTFSLNALLFKNINYRVWYLDILLFQSNRNLFIFFNCDVVDFIARLSGARKSFRNRKIRNIDIETVL